MPPTARRGRTGRPPRTSRAQILDAARLLIDRDGWTNLTVRGLAKELGVAPTTLYHHVRDKRDLLRQVLDDRAGQVRRPQLPDDPRERITAATEVIHDTLAATPWIVEVLTSDDLLGTSALWMVEAILAGAVECGCTDEQAVELYRSIWYYTAGEILVRSGSARRRTESEEPIYRDEALRNVDATELPRLAVLADRWPALTARDTYSRGLRALVTGFLADRG
jgi:AcrR family transcriptional regulator